MPDQYQLKYIKQLSEIYAKVHDPDATERQIRNLSEDVASIIDQIFEDGYRDGQKDAHYNAPIR